MMRLRGSKEPAEPEPETLDEVLLDAIRGIVYESHEELVDYDEEMEYEEPGREESGGGRGLLPMLLVGGAFAALGYMLGKRSQSGGQMSGQTSIGIQDATEKAADRTQEMAENTAETIREGGQDVSERTEEATEQASERIEESGEKASEQMEEKGSEAGDETDDQE